MDFSRSRRFYRLLLRLYPASFREANGREMESVFVASLRMQREMWGELGTAIGWGRILLDTVVHAARVRLLRLGTRRSSASRRSVHEPGSSAVGPRGPGRLGRLHRSLWEDGRFAARHLGVPPARLMELASAAEQPTPINSYCTVFAETALLEQLRGGASREQVALGCMHSVAQRVMEIGHFTDPLVVTGGLPVYYPGVVAAIEEKAGIVVKVAPQSIMCGALGAALMAFDTV